ncbi:MAG: glycosyltransferase family 39 protein [bacterium]|nr:glycosyltransferase family 39 protein [bacterium]
MRDEDAHIERSEADVFRILLHTLILVAAGIAAFLIYYVALSPRLPGNAISTDGIRFAQTAREFSRGRGVSTGAIHPCVLQFVRGGDRFPDVYNPPLYPMVLGLFFMFTGSNSTGIWICNLSLFLATTVLVYLFAREAFDEGVGLMAGFLFLSNPRMLMGILHMQHEHLFILLVTALLYLCYRSRLASVRSNAAAGAIIGLCYLAEYPLWLLIVPLAVFSARLSREGREVRLAAILGGFLAVAVFWWIRNIAVTGNPFYSLRSLHEIYGWDYLMTVAPGVQGYSLIGYMRRRIDPVILSFPSLYTVFRNWLFLLCLAAAFHRFDDERFERTRRMVYLLFFSTWILTGLVSRDFIMFLLAFLPVACVIVAGFVRSACAAAESKSRAALPAAMAAIIALNAIPTSRMTDLAMLGDYSGLSHLLDSVPRDRVIINNGAIALSWFADRRALELPYSPADYQPVVDALNGKIAVYIGPDFPEEVEGNPALQGWAPIGKMIAADTYPPGSGFDHAYALSGQGWLLY